MGGNDHVAMVGGSCVLVILVSDPVHRVFLVYSDLEANGTRGWDLYLTILDFPNVLFN